MGVVVILSLIGIAFSYFVFRAAINTSYGIFHISIILMGLSILDVFMPALIWSIYGIPAKISIYTAYSLDFQMLANGLVYYLTFYFIMISITLFQTRAEKTKSQYEIHIKKNMLNILLGISLTLALLDLYLTIISHGGISTWFWDKIHLRWIANTDTHTGGIFIETLLKSIDWRGIFNILMLTAFYYRKRLNNKNIYTFILPSAAFLLALTTFYRGSILLLALGLVFVEYMRVKRYNTDHKVKHIIKNNKKKIYKGILVAVTLFIIVGAIRGSFSSKAWNDNSNVSEIAYSNEAIKVLSQGSGLSSISYIVEDFNRKTDLLMGKTYIDMLLLPIPRIIYTSKPKWYGITDITLAMNWPESSQSAVTIPGEAYANFGWMGLVLAIIFGLLFRYLYYLTVRPDSIYLTIYPGVVIYIIFSANWMSFTGIMNQLDNFLIGVFILTFILKRKRSNAYSQKKI